MGQIKVFWLEPIEPGSRGGRYRRTDTGEEFAALGDAPVGAMWDAHWMPDVYHRGPDGIYLIVKTPGGDWPVDAEANNCTRKGQRHQCWVRHGDPRTGNIHVDKNGDTCSAGAGSILKGSYHGFLHHGHLTNA